ncbi:alpha/beta hydrolase [Streptomyces sp. NPDC033538]|uniref:alpha/beta fold hydrolase n=1 Tax=Streptomyces sp. NPDC033538 TaxID=3155367 RepID=UPI00340BD141
MKLSEAVPSVALNTLSRVSGRPAGAATFALFHMPLARSTARPAERELIERARVGRVELDGKHAVTYEWGDGARTVLLVHGWQSRSSRLSDLVTGFLDRGYRVIAFDAPGHGAASGRSATILDYRAVITALHERYGTFDGLVAHSLGALASFFALRHGVKAERIVTISGVCDFGYLVDEFAAALALRPRLKTELHRRIARDLFPGLPVDRSPFSATDTAEEVHAPVLVIHDEDDTRIGVEQGRRLSGAFGDRARLVVTSGLGHRRILGDPEVVRAAVDFVEHGPSQKGGPVDVSRVASD